MVKTIYPSPSQFKETKNNHKSTVLTISTNFVFSIIPKYPDLRGHGLALVFISPKKCAIYMNIIDTLISPPH